MFAQSRVRKKKRLTDSILIVPFKGQKQREKEGLKVIEQVHEKQVSYSFTELVTPKIATQPLGTIKTNNPSIKKLLTPLDHSTIQGVDLDIQVGLNHPLELESLLMFWRKFAHFLKEQNKSGIFPMLTKRDPRIINDSTIIYEVDSEWIKELLIPELIDLLAYLKDQLKNHQLKVELRVLEEAKKVVSPFSPQEKFKILSEKNPNLNMLQRMFNLDLDF